MRSAQSPPSSSAPTRRTRWRRRRTAARCVAREAGARALRCAAPCPDARAAARRRAAQLLLAPPGADVVGVALTATLATAAPKRGEHACHVATRSARGTAHYALTLAKGARDRGTEDAVASRMLLQALADACGVPADLVAPHTLRAAGEAVSSSLVPFADPLGALLARDPAVRVLQLRGGAAVAAVGAAAPRVLLPGSFNPLHAGHAALLAAAVAAAGPGARGGYELSVSNADKGALPRAEVERRAAQFAPDAPPLVLTDAPLFVQKAALLPGTTFVVGVDTAVRIVMPKYYGGDPSAMRAVLQAILDARCSFLVAGRLVDGAWVEPNAVAAPPGMEGAARAAGRKRSVLARAWLTRACVCARRAVPLAAELPAGHLLHGAARARRRRGAAGALTHTHTWLAGFYTARVPTRCRACPQHAACSHPTCCSTWRGARGQRILCALFVARP
jgi:hypothetical protein